MIPLTPLRVGGVLSFPAEAGRWKRRSARGR